MLTAYPKTNPGRRGLPLEVKAAMVADYQRLKSIRGVAKLWGRTNQCIWEILKTAGVPCVKKNLLQAVIYKGEKYTPGKGGYLRSTRFQARGKKPGFETQLHRVVWVDHNGPIPDGYQVGFKDGNKANCAIENLMCMPLREIVRLKATGANHHTKSAKAKLSLLVEHAAGAPSLVSQLKKEAA